MLVLCTKQCCPVWHTPVLIHSGGGLRSSLTVWDLETHSANPIPAAFFRGLRRRSPIRHRLPTEPLTAEEPLPAVAPIALRALKVEIKFMIWLRKPGSWALLARVASIATEPPCSAF